MAGRRNVAELRPVRRRDVETLSAWLPGVAADVGCARWSGAAALSTADGERLVRAEGAAQAFVVYDTDVPERGAAVVRLLAVDPEHRRLGTGYRTALALEQRLARSAKRCYVLVPARLGLALYFWLRLGYRPLTQRDWPAPAGEGPALWLVRQLP